MSDDKLVHVIASSLDYPSVYMGGPSPGSKRRVGRLLDAIESAGYRVVPAEPTEAMLDAVRWDDDDARDGYVAMLAAAPKVTT